MGLDAALAIPRRELDDLLPVGSKWVTEDGYRCEIVTAPYPVFGRVEVDVLTWSPWRNGEGSKDHVSARYVLARYVRVDEWPKEMLPKE